VAVASAGPYANHLHLAPDKIIIPVPYQSSFFTGWIFDADYSSGKEPGNIREFNSCGENMQQLTRLQATFYRLF